MATMEDAINAHISFLKFHQMHPNEAIRCGLDIEIRTLKDTPRNRRVIERLLERKRFVHTQTEKMDQHESLQSEIAALEWLHMIVNSGAGEWYAWSRLRELRIVY